MQIFHLAIIEIQISIEIKKKRLFKIFFTMSQLHENSRPDEE